MIVEIDGVRLTKAGKAASRSSACRLLSGRVRPRLLRVRRNRIKREYGQSGDTGRGGNILGNFHNDLFFKRQAAETGGPPSSLSR